jgi:hypothetical protein
LEMPRFNKEQLKYAVASSDSYAGTLRNLKMCETGGNYQTLKKYISLWEIDASHFLSPSERIKKINPSKAIPLETILQKGTSYNRSELKRRLYKAGLKKPICEICGQNEFWHGKRISLILDHINGVRNDNRLENLRIVCPNCNAALDTHCGKLMHNQCPTCQNQKPINRKYCSLQCYRKYGTKRIMLKTRKVERPAFDTLLKEVAENGYLATSRKYGVSDNAVRKWISVYKKYEK